MCALSKPSLPHFSRERDYSCDLPRVRFASGGRLLKVHFAQSEAAQWNSEQFPGERGKRGACMGFSFGSRRRMLDRLNSVKVDSSLPVFLTMTLPDEVFDDCASSFAKTAKHWLDNFQKRLVRLVPGACGFWRIEWQSRKSGKYEGKLVPHFHLLVWGLPERKIGEREIMHGREVVGLAPIIETYVPTEDTQMTLNFLKVIASAPPKTGDVHTLESTGASGQWRFAGSSKFVARCSNLLDRVSLAEACPDSPQASLARNMSFLDWASLAWYHVVASGNVDHLTAGVRVERVKSWGGVMSYCAKYMAKSDSDFLSSVPFGRSWGIFNRRFIPWAEVVEVKLDSEVGIRLRRVARHYLERRFGRRVHAPYGVTLYCDVANFRRLWERPPPDPF